MFKVGKVTLAFRDVCPILTAEFLGQVILKIQSETHGKLGLSGQEGNRTV